MTNRHIIDRHLPDRTKLMFYFPKPSKGANYYVVELPFFENVVIKESKKARYQKYSLISRSSNLYSYLGADSRNFNLSFNMTLPHIVDLHPELTIEKFVSLESDPENVEATKEKFKKPYAAQDGTTGMAFQLGTNYTQHLAKDSARSVLMDANITGGLNVEQLETLKTKYGITQASMNELIDEIPDLKVNSPVASFDSFQQGGPKFINQSDAEQQDATQGINSNQDDQVRYRLIDLIIYWTNIVRSSVVNYSKNPIYGPPVIRLRHGILYQDIPCICTAYSIDYNEAAGYDLDTLLPRQLKINMKLEEIRTGDFGEFDATDVVKKDNLAGWEAVVTGKTHSMDPGYGGVL